MLLMEHGPGREQFKRWLTNVISVQELFLTLSGLSQQPTASKGNTNIPNRHNTITIAMMNYFYVFVETYSYPFLTFFIYIYVCIQIIMMLHLKKKLTQFSCPPINCPFLMKII